MHRFNLARSTAGAHRWYRWVAHPQLLRAARPQRVASSGRGQTDNQRVARSRTQFLLRDNGLDLLDLNDGRCMASDAQACTPRLIQSLKFKIVIVERNCPVGRRSARFSAAYCAIFDTDYGFATARQK